MILINIIELDARQGEIMRKLLIGLLTLGTLTAFANETPYDKAVKLSEANISCQQYRATLEDLLSESPLNLHGIEMVRDLYNGCIDDVSTSIEKGSSNVDLLVQELHGKRVICDVETRMIEELLSDSSAELDSVAIEHATEGLNDCKDQAKEILNF